MNANELMNLALSLPNPWDTHDEKDGASWDNMKAIAAFPRAFNGSVPGYPKVERLITKLGPSIAHHDKPDAFYRPVENFIRLPVPEAFFSRELYAHTLSHELSHWTAHNGVVRNVRPPMELDSLFGNVIPTAHEELTAEIAVYLSADMLGLGELSRFYSVHYQRAWLDNVGERDKRANKRDVFSVAFDAASRIRAFYQEALR